MRSQKPILHARDHMPGGADPIQLFATGANTYPDGVHRFSNLLGYWPLIEGAAPYPDENGLESDAVIIGSGASTITQAFTPAALAADPSGVGLTGDKLKYATAPFHYLSVADIVAGFPLDLRLAEWTIACWLRPFATSNTWFAPLFNNWAGLTAGWGIFVEYPNREIHLLCADGGSPGTSLGIASGSVPVDEWIHVVATFKYSDAVTYGPPTRSTAVLYLNGAVAAAGYAQISVSGTLTPTTLNLPSSHSGFQLGFGSFPGSGSDFYSGLGALNHVALWGTALSAEDAMYLYLSGNEAAAGSTIVADGSGGFTVVPPRTVYHNGA